VTSQARYVPLLLVAAILTPVTAADPASTVIDLGSRRELFVDRFLIDSLIGRGSNSRRPATKGWPCGSTGRGRAFSVVCHRPARRRPLTGPTTGPPGAGADGVPPPRVTCNAESADGIAWTKPDVGCSTSAVAGRTRRPRRPAAVLHNFCPMLDDRPGVPADERYKALAGTAQSGLHAFASGRRPAGGGL